MNATIQRTEYLNQKQLEEIAKNDKNRVYTYTYDKTEKPISADEARDLIRDIRAKYLELRAEHPDWEDDKIRHHICSQKYSWKHFAKLYSNNFINATNKDTDERKMRYQFYLLYVQKQVEQGIYTPEQSRAMVTEYFAKEAQQQQSTKNK